MKSLIQYLYESLDQVFVIADKIAKLFKFSKKHGSKFDSKDKESIAEFKNYVAIALDGIRNGYINQKGTKFGISEENFISVFNDVFGDEDLCKEIIRQAEKYDYTFRFKKDSEWQKAGYKRPDED